jgi:glutaconyl-CoA/methylmalonyl-CoA decarboxylase subunit gamma
MKKNIKILVNGKPYAVEIEDLGGAQLSVTVDGTAYEVSVEDQATPAAAASPAPVERAVAAPVSRAATRPATTGGNVMTAPMPGVILDISVRVGDKINYGQQLCALEAMKMKNAMRAPKEAVIASVEVQDGQKVAYGDILFRFE